MLHSIRVGLQVAKYQRKSDRKKIKSLQAACSLAAKAKIFTISHGPFLNTLPI